MRHRVGASLHHSLCCGATHVCLETTPVTERGKCVWCDVCLPPWQRGMERASGATEWTWPSGLRRRSKVPVRKSVGSNPTVHTPTRGSENSHTKKKHPSFFHVLRVGRGGCLSHYLMDAHFPRPFLLAPVLEGRISGDGGIHRDLPHESIDVVRPNVSIALEKGIDANAVESRYLGKEARGPWRRGRQLGMPNAVFAMARRSATHRVRAFLVRERRNKA